jgi:hypothetical protein
VIDQTRSIGCPVPTGIHAIHPFSVISLTRLTNSLSILAAMNEEYDEQVSKPNDLDEEDFVDSIGMLELLVRPGKTIGQCHFHCSFHLLMVAHRDSDLSWKRSSNW